MIFLNTSYKFIIELLNKFVTVWNINNALLGTFL